MKNLLILTSLLISGSLWASPMDDVCSLEGNSLGFATDYPKLEEWCERNNILEVTKIRLSDVTFWVNSYCRFDRNVYVQEIKQPKGKRIFYDLGCVLYDPKGRARL